MIEIERPNIVTAETSEDGKHGTFVIEPLNAVTELLLVIPFAEYCSVHSPVLLPPA